MRPQACINLIVIVVLTFRQLSNLDNRDFRGLHNVITILDDPSLILGPSSRQSGWQSYDTSSADLLMSVPFYIYSEMDWLSEKFITTIGNYTFKDWLQLNAEERELPHKHDDDIKLYIAATKHPMRVFNPEEAKLFIVPSITSLLEMSVVYRLDHLLMCRHTKSAISEKICGRELMVYMNNVLRSSKWFHRSKGRDHIAFLTYHQWNHPFWMGVQFEYITRVNVIQYDEGLGKFNAQNRISFETMYVGSPCPVVPYHEKTADLAMIADLRLESKMSKDQINMRDRRNICKWTKGRYHMDFCGKGPQCPALGQARLGFHVRGDSRSANRLFDTLLSGTVPIFTLSDQYTLHQPFINWKNISFYIPMGDYEDSVNEELFHKALDGILKDKDLIEEKTKAVVENRDLFDFDTLVPFDVYGYMFQAKLFPDLPRKEASKYSALIMPKTYE